MHICTLDAIAHAEASTRIGGKRQDASLQHLRTTIDDFAADDGQCRLQLLYRLVLLSCGRDDRWAREVGNGSG